MTGRLKRDVRGCRHRGFFFQAEDGIRDRDVTGVQTCALPISKDFKLIGTPVKRLDTPEKVDGTAQFGIDVRLPGMKFAAVAACPVFGGKLASVDDAKAKAIPGVQQVVRLDDAVAVVAADTWAAKQGLA